MRVVSGFWVLKEQCPVRGWRIVLGCPGQAAVRTSGAVLGATRAPLARAIGRWIDGLEPVRDSP